MDSYDKACNYTTKSIDVSGEIGKEEEVFCDDKEIKNL